MVMLCKKRRVSDHNLETDEQNSGGYGLIRT